MDAPEPRFPPRFRVVRRIGGGAMGIVHEAIDEERGARVALKTLRHVDADALVRFKNEFRTLADIGHENLVGLGELLEHEGAWFFTMELVAGVDLLSWVRPGVDVSAAESDPSSPSRAAETLPAASNPTGSVTGEGQRRSGTLDVERVRDAFAQLVRALDALHAAGKVHRDVKPSNVLVTPEGRVVLLDFGIAGDARKHTGAAGTVAYMAPEQADAHAPTPAIDHYAVGAVLYEALTGTLPFEGSAFEVLEGKRRATPPPPDAVDPRVPSDLAALALALLAADPTNRPDASEILSVLVGDDRAAPTTSPTSGGSVFVGRRRELAELMRAWTRVEQGQAVTVYVHGESGVGKTALARRFADEVEARAPRALVLSSRCYERESVPFKAVDGAVDALRAVFAAEDAETLAALLPEDAGLLGRVFPVLAPEIARAGRGGGDAPPDEDEQRSRVFSAFRELFGALARTRPLLLVLEDLQWADADSLFLLRELLRARLDEAPPPLLLLATVRTTEPIADRSGPPASLPQSRLNVGSSTMPGDVRILPLGRLPRDDAERWAELLVGRERAKAIAEESGGHPLLVEELARAGADGATSLAAAVRARRDALSTPARALLSLVLLARAPLPETVLRAAAEIADATEFDRAASELRQERLARRVNARGRSSLEPYHGRVREALRGDVPSEETAGHRALALAFESEEPREREALAEHWRGAGETRLAADHAIAAAREARARLAFERAARLHQWAIDLVGEAATETELAALAEAQREAGRGVAAADAYLAAAERSAGARALDLRRRAAHELFATGHVEAGREALAPALAALGIDAEPPHPVTALAARAVAYLRGTTFRPRLSATEDERARADVTHTLALGIALHDPVRSHRLSRIALRFALATGDRGRVSRAFALDAFLASLRGLPVQNLAEAHELADEAGEPAARALAAVASSAARFANDDFLRARDEAREARRIAREHARGATWELAAATWLNLRALVAIGDLRGARAFADDTRDGAETRGDRLTLGLASSGTLVLPRLAVGDVDGVRVSFGSSADPSEVRSPRARMDDLVARGLFDLYLGDGTAAYRRSTELLRGLVREGAAGAAIDRAQALAIHTRGAIAHARKLPQRARELLDEAQATANEVAGIGSRYALVEASLLRGAIARARGETSRAIASFQRANGASAELGLRLHGAVAALAAGRLRGGDEGRGQVERALASLRKIGVTDPDAIAAAFGC